MFLERSPQCPNQVLVLRNLQDKTSVLTRRHLEILSYVVNLEPATGKVMQTNKKTAAEKFRCGFKYQFCDSIYFLDMVIYEESEFLKKISLGFFLKEK